MLVNLLKNAHEAARRQPKRACLANALLFFYSTKASGTGVGVTLCREIVEAHGDALDAGTGPAAVWSSRSGCPLAFSRWQISEPASGSETRIRDEQPALLRIYCQSVERRARLKKLWQDLKRREIFRTGVIYAVVAWAVVQAASIAFPTFGAPVWAMRALLVAAFAGFPVAIVLAWVFDVTLQGIDVTPPGDAAPPPAPRPRRWWVRPLIAAPVMAAIVGGTTWLWTSGLSTSGDPEFTRQLRPDELPIVAVLPLENLTGRKELDWAGAGVANVVRDDLAQSRFLAVVSAARTMRLSGSATDLNRLFTEAAESGITHILTGEILRTPSGLTITSRLTDLRRNVELGANRRERSRTRLGTYRVDRGRLRDQAEPGAPGNRKGRRICGGLCHAQHRRVRGVRCRDRELPAVQLRRRAARVRDRRAEGARFRHGALPAGPHTGVAGRHRRCARRGAQGAEGRLSTAGARACVHRGRSKLLRAGLLWRREPVPQATGRVPLRNGGASAADLFAVRRRPLRRGAGRGRDARSARSGDEVAWSAIADLRLKLGRYDAADEPIAKFLALSPGNPNAHFLDGDAHFFRKQYDEAMPAYRKALELDPAFIDATQRIAQIDVLQGRSGRAIDLLVATAASSAAAPASRTTAAIDAADLLRAERRCPEAVALLVGLEKEFSAEQVSVSRALSIRALCRLDAGDPAGARALAAEAIAKAVGVAPRFLLTRARAEIAGGDLDAAMHTAAELRTMSADAGAPQPAAAKAAHYVEGLVQLERGDPDAAAQSMRAAVNMAGREYEIYRLGLARALAAGGDAREARQLARAAGAMPEPASLSLDLEPSRRDAARLLADL